MSNLRWTIVAVMLAAMVIVDLAHRLSCYLAMSVLVAVVLCIAWPPRGTKK